MKDERHTDARGGALALLRRMLNSYACGFILFCMLMLFKLVLFDRGIVVRYMEMTRDDVIIAAGSLMAISFWTFWLPLRGQRIALALLNIALTVLMVADLIYFRYFQDLITVPVLTQAGQVGALGDSIWSLTKSNDMLFFADWLLVLPALAYSLIPGRGRARTAMAGKGRQTRPLRRRLLRSAAIGSIGIAGLLLAVLPIQHANRTWAAGVFAGDWWSVSLYNVTGVIGFHAYDAYRYMDQAWLQGGKIADERLAATKGWFEERGKQRKALQSDPLFGAYKGSNVVALQLEAFQSFVIGRQIGGQYVTPNINKLIDESVYFERFYHQTAQGRTSDADLAANISLQPLPAGSVFFRYAQNHYDSLPAILKSAGYTASVYHAYEGGFWNRNNMYRTMQYDAFYTKKDYRIDEPLGWSVGDRSFFRQSVELMPANAPFYAFLISLTSHHPYTLPQMEQQLDVGGLKGTMLGDYLQAVHYVDAAVGEMIDQLKEAKLWDNTIFLLYGDHDNSILDWELYEQWLGKPLSELERIQQLQQVPLVVHLPDGKHAGRHTEASGQLDIAPTLLHLLGIDSSGSYMIGLPLIVTKPDHDRQVVFRSGAFTDGLVWYEPAEDGDERHDRCLDASSGAQLERGACQAGKEAARQQLTASDLVITHDLIAQFRKR
ncbi:LTA synthase family protein [Paenibacillus sp. GCM10027626]|uniref:LTA synthase family protein n=1 Tax=Paenibacillus sp. GCM10027626 TaxID=3273411 RepID=UPI003628BA2A